jgi:hypothetical protein
MSSTIVADFVRLLHILLVLFVLFGSASNSYGILTLHVAVCISLLVHWVANSDTCSLTLLESKLRGVNTQETFMHSIVSPVYKIESSTLSRLSYFATILVLVISLRKLYMSEEFTTAFVSLLKLQDITENLKIVFKV